MSDTTTISLKADTADALHAIKERSQSYDDVVSDLLHRAGEA